MKRTTLGYYADHNKIGFLYPTQAKTGWKVLWVNLHYATCHANERSKALRSTDVAKKGFTYCLETATINFIPF